MIALLAAALFPTQVRVPFPQAARVAVEVILFLTR